MDFRQSISWSSGAVRGIRIVRDLSLLPFAEQSLCLSLGRRWGGFLS